EAERAQEPLAAASAEQQRSAEILEAAVTRLERETAALMARLPETARARIAPLAARLPTGPEPAAGTLAQRFQTVVGVLNELDRFHGDVTIANEVHTLADGRRAEVTALYLGLGQAWAVTAAADAARTGRATDAGWT